VTSAIYALDRGEVAMAVMADTQLLAVPPGTPRTERVLVTLREIPGPVYVARGGLSVAERARIQAALLAFKPDPRRPPTASNAALQALPPKHLAALEPYVGIAREVLARAR
jgi:hypothetical protein